MNPRVRANFGVKMALVIWLRCTSVYIFSSHICATSVSPVNVADSSWCRPSVTRQHQPAVITSSTRRTQVPPRDSVMKSGFLAHIPFVHLIVQLYQEEWRSVRADETQLKWSKTVEKMLWIHKWRTEELRHCSLASAECLYQTVGDFNYTDCFVSESFF